MTEATPPEPQLKPPFGVKLSYGLGAVADSAWTAASGFVFFYYTAVLGLPGSLVGAAVFIGLVADAGVDPFFGSWSDNIRSRLGRRVPLMLVAAPLIAISVGLLFSPPPGASQPVLFAWLAVTSVAVRSFVSMFHVPYVALGAELSGDYHERNAVVAWRTIFAVLAAVVVTGLAYSLFFQGEGGLQKPERYPGFGWSAGALMLVCSLVCGVGVLRFAAGLKSVPAVPIHLLRRLPGEVVEIFRNRSFRTLFLSAAVCYAAVGVNGAFNSHAYVFVWRLQPEMIRDVTFAFLGGMFAGVPLTPLIGRRLEKRTTVLIGMALVVLAWLLLGVPRITQTFMPAGQAAEAPIAVLVALAGVGAGICAIAYYSMMADAADEHHHLFGRPREGLYFAGLGFAFKGATGVGVLISGFALDLIRFPKDVGRQVGAVLPEPLLQRVVFSWTLVPAILVLVGMAILLGYDISRRRHAEIAAALNGAHSS
ncbi:Na+/melibiose symporter [Phenylobacterium zucineum HLK1]|uniref:Na+/melibiose symporter n=1 Tax=Phenylobacterium zucineum (strain HLK1) TaxID=450851 RepID=B4R9J8_PHEZH|nr:MFS transporter [Phenylobacterium zucineum]ACG79458.1 Na+/melibiose symporter [Phenylobacterium zucineum HLK1]